MSGIVELVGNTVTNNPLITLNLSYDDAAEYRISQDDIDFVNVRWQAFANTVDFLLLGGDGEKDVYVQFRDSDRNESEKYMIKVVVDTTPCAIESFTINDGAETTQERLVTLKIKAKGRPQKMQVFNEDDFTEEQKDSKEFIDYTDELKWLLSSSNGQKVVFIRVMDASGNKTDFVNSKIMLDKREPIAPKILSPVDKSVLQDRIIEVTGTAEPGSTVIVTIESID